MKLESRIERLENDVRAGTSNRTIIFLDPGESKEEAKARYEATHNTQLDAVIFVKFVRAKGDETETPTI